MQLQEVKPMILTKERKNELNTRLHWQKQLVSLFLGVVFGVFNVQGIIPICIYVVALFIATYYYLNSYLLSQEETERVDGEKIWSMMLDGVVQSIATFLIGWIVCFTMFYHPME